MSGSTEPRASSGFAEPPASSSPSTARPRARNARIEQLIARLQLRETMQQHPYALIGGAFSLGYVLGGGRIGTVVLRLGGGFATRELKRIADAFVEGLQGV